MSNSRIAIRLSMQVVYFFPQLLRWRWRTTLTPMLSKSKARNKQRATAMKNSIQTYRPFRGFRRNTGPGQLTPYWPPIKSIGKWKLKKPRTINGTRFKFWARVYRNRLLVRPCSSVGRVTVDLIQRSWVRFPPWSKDFFLAPCGSVSLF